MKPRIPNYVFLDATHIMDIFSCFTFTSEPHWDINTANPVVVNGVKDFALYGGNFLAQCEAIETYENLGYFMTDKGIKSTGNILNNPSHQYHTQTLHSCRYMVLYLKNRQVQYQAGHLIPAQHGKTHPIKWFLIKGQTLYV